MRVTYLQTENLQIQKKKKKSANKPRKKNRKLKPYAQKQKKTNK